MADPLPARPAWFDDITEHWQRYLKFSNIDACTARRQQLERLKAANKFELACRTGNPGTHYIVARLRPTSIDGEATESLSKSI